MSSYILAIDQGTTSTRSCLIDSQGNLIGASQEPFEQIFPEAGWVEHRTSDIWKTTVSTIQKVLEKTGIDGKKIAAIGITNQRETVALWSRHTGEPVYNAIVWQCRRTADFCEKLKKNKSTIRLIRKLTGLIVDPYFSASKIHWILNKVLKKKKVSAQWADLACGTMDTFLLWKLTNGKVHATDVSNASRTMLMNIHTGKWDDRLLKIFSIPKEILPEIGVSSGVFGHTRNLGFLPDNIPIAGIAGDQQAALFGQHCFEPGESKCTFGTGSFMLMNVGKNPIFSQNQLLTTVAWKLKNQPMMYALEGGAFICGAAVQWLRDGLGMIKNSYEIEELAKSVTSSEGVEFVPALTGLGAPYWRANARGLISGITRGTTRAHVARATLEAMALQNAEILLTMQKDLGRKLKNMKVDGGASANDLLMQIQADYLGVPVIRPKNLETTAMGAAYLAGLGVGFWKDLTELKKLGISDRVFDYQMSSRARSARLKKWRMAVAKA